MIQRRLLLVVGFPTAAIAVAAVVFLTLAYRAPSAGIPTSLPIPAGTVFSLPPNRAPNGTILDYYRYFNGSGSAPAGQCLKLVGAWSATSFTIAPWPPSGMNGTLDGPITSGVPGGGIGFSAFRPDTITVTATIQWIVVSCP